MKTALIVLFAICLIGIGCLVNSRPDASLHIKRYAGITGLKPDSIQVYKDLHAHAWPAVLKKIKECNIRNYSIYIKQIDGKPYLFSYFEYVGDDFDADMQKMAADPSTRKWWKRTDPMQMPLPDAAAKGKIWSDMPEVFHAE